MSGEIWLGLVAGVAGGVVNAAAGGAKLFVFPLLLAAGLPPIAANATAAVAMWPAQSPALWVYRDRLRGDRGLVGLALPAFAGALAGAGALIVIDEDAFIAVVPGLLAIALVAILAGERLTAAARRVAGEGRALPGVLLFLSGVYGGFFGAGLGFMLIATLTAAGVADIHDANARKNLLAVGINTTAVIPLALSGLVAWSAAPWVLVGGLAGGYLGARLARRLPPKPMRLTVAAVGTVLTISFLVS